MLLGRVFISIGIIMLLASFAFIPYSRNDETTVGRGISSGFLIAASTNLHVTATPAIGDNIFSLYFLDAIDANNTVVQNRSIDLITPLLEVENITNYDDTIEIPQPGMYALVFTSPHNDTWRLLVSIVHLMPNNRVLWMGISIMMVGVAFLIISWERFRQRLNVSK